jgi:hypothetical protein
MRRVLTTWIHDDEDPFKLLGFEATSTRSKRDSPPAHVISKG